MAGYLCIVLHAHLPFIRHPEHERFLEEDWLFEAVTETYLPLLDSCWRLRDEDVPFGLTLSLSPPLCEMLADPLLQQRYLVHLDRLLQLMRSELTRTRGTSFEPSAQMYLDRLLRVRELYVERWHMNLVEGFRRLQDDGVVEITSCAATHGLLPLMETDNAVRAQILVAKANYEKHFGRPPRGMWLPECAYRPAQGGRPGLDSFLAKAGIRFFFTETHGVAFGSPRPKYGVFRPVVTPSGVYVFGRDVETSKQVWSRKEGYPGDGLYREFYRDLGYDGDYEHVRFCLHPDGVRRSIGVKYHRITSDDAPLHAKEPYDPRAAEEKVAEHAGNFIFNRRHQVRYLQDLLGVEPVLVSMYDAELFGHWWYEGPRFLEYVMRKSAFDQDDYELTTPSRFLDEGHEVQVVTPARSSWGAGGHLRVWINGSNDWIYRHLHKAEERMIELTHAFPAADGLLRRALNQAARELLLAQSSDWAFLMSTGTAIPYAEKRTRDHIHNFAGLYAQVMGNRIEEPYLARLESSNSIFQEIDYRVYA